MPSEKIKPTLNGLYKCFFRILYVVRLVFYTNMYVLPIVWLEPGIKVKVIPCIISKQQRIAIVKKGIKGR